MWAMAARRVKMIEAVMVFILIELAIDMIDRIGLRMIILEYFRIEEASSG